MLPEVMQNPVSNYSDPTVLEDEINVLFRQFPLALAHATELEQSGRFVTHDATGVPILLVCGKAGSFSCPYHSWTYELTGDLRGMPHPIGFEGIDKSDYGLVELPAFERFGLIWVVPSVQDKAIDIDSWLKPMAEQFGSLNMQDHVVFKKWSLERDMGWRVALEGFQESYHFCSAHKHTACSSYLDNQAVFLQQYPHVRHAVPMPGVVGLKDIEEEEWDYRPNFMTQNYLFPANFVQVMTDHIYVHTILPNGPGKCTFQCKMLIPEAPQSEKAERYWTKNYELVRTVFDEDFQIGEGIQKGLDSGANQAFVFGRNECCLHFGQDSIEDALAGRLTV